MRQDKTGGQALAGVAASASYDKADWAEVYAKEAYAIADAMIAARNGGQR